MLPAEQAFFGWTRINRRQNFDVAVMIGANSKPIQDPKRAEITVADWLSKLHEYFLKQEPFVLATITAYQGSSPDPVGPALFCSATQSDPLISSTDRITAMKQRAGDLLNQPIAHFQEQLPLGKIAGLDNGVCVVIYEYFDAAVYPAWLHELRRYQKNGTSCTLVREYSIHGHVVQTEVRGDPVALQSHGNLSSDNASCQTSEDNQSRLLLRHVTSDTIAVSIIGEHPVATEIEKQARNLPIDLTRYHRGQENINGDSFIIVMTSDHEQDYLACEAALRQLTHNTGFVGCIGSDKKAAVFKQRLLQKNITRQQLQQFYMPVGMTQIKGKQSSIVAASIIAQILAHHSRRRRHP